MELFSKTFDKQYYQKAMAIYAKVGGPEPRVNSWELYDKAWVWPSIRKYEIITDEMNILEHFEENLNTNITNENLVDKFIKNATYVRNMLSNQFPNDFVDPVTTIKVDEE